MSNKIKITQICNCINDSLPLGILAICDKGKLYSIVGLNGTDVMLLKLNLITIDKNELEKIIKDKNYHEN